MTKRIGPTFYNELLAAGLVGLPFSWGDDGTLEFDPSMTQEQVDAVLAVYAAHNPDFIPPLTGEDVNNERERRLSLGCTVTLESGQGPIPVQTRDEIDHRNLLTLESQSIKAVISGAPDKQFAFRDAQDKTWTLTALEMMDMTAKVAAFGADVFAKSWAIKSIDPIPANYADDKYWT